MPLITVNLIENVFTDVLGPAERASIRRSSVCREPETVGSFEVCVADGAGIGVGQ